MIVTKHVFVEGIVQGVGFRMHTQKKACELGVSGWVRNLSDGRVEVIAQADARAMESFLIWLNRGPDRARVEKVTFEYVSDAEPVDSTGFFVR